MHKFLFVAIVLPKLFKKLFQERLHSVLKLRARLFQFAYPPQPGFFSGLRFLVVISLEVTSTLCLEQIGFITQNYCYSNIQLVHHMFIVLVIFCLGFFVGFMRLYQIKSIYFFVFCQKLLFCLRILQALCFQYTGNKYFMLCASFAVIFSANITKTVTRTLQASIMFLYCVGCVRS